MVVSVDLTHPHVIVTIAMIFLLYLSIKFGDSEKSTAWMFFLAPIGLFLYGLYWVSVLVGAWVWLIIAAFIIVAIIKSWKEFF